MLGNTQKQVSADCGSREGRGFESRRSPYHLRVKRSFRRVPPKACRSSRAAVELNCDLLAAVVDKGTPRSLMFTTLFEDVRGIVSSHEAFRLCMLDRCNGFETLA